MRRSGRRSSAVEQLIRNQQVIGSNPIVGSTLGILATGRLNPPPAILSVHYCLAEQEAERWLTC